MISGYLWIHMRNGAESMGYNIPQYVKPVKSKKEMAKGHSTKPHNSCII